jgi:hypothetical protein
MFNHLWLPILNAGSSSRSLQPKTSLLDIKIYYSAGILIPPPIVFLERPSHWPACQPRATRRPHSQKARSWRASKSSMASYGSCWFWFIAKSTSVIQIEYYQLCVMEIMFIRCSAQAVLESSFNRSAHDQLTVFKIKILTTTLHIFPRVEVLSSPDSGSNVAPCTTMCVRTRTHRHSIFGIIFILQRPLDHFVRQWRSK